MNSKLLMKLSGLCFCMMPNQAGATNYLGIVNRWNL
jgi:hypothetical protein